MKKKKLLMTAIVIFGLTTITIAQVPSYVPTNGLVGWWLFNGNANDLSGNGNNGTVNGATLTTDRFGATAKAYDFNGINDFISLANSGSINFSQGISFSAWIKTNDIRLASIVDKETTCNSYGYRLNTRNDGQIWTEHGCYGNGQPGCYTAKANINYTSNTWYFIVGTLDLINGNRIYVNGNLVDQGAVTQLINNSKNIEFGRATGGTGEYFWGIIDDIGIWNRALTQQEITDLYNGCQQPAQPTTACYETATFNNTTCQWDVTGTQPEQPSTACYETASFNTTTCQWDVTGSPASISQPTNQTINVNNNAQFSVGSSDPNATYQWQTDLGFGFQNLSNAGQYSGVTTDTLTVFNVTMSNNNQNFRSIVSSGSCSDTSDVVVLTVNDNASIDEANQDNLFAVFPNPAQSIIAVKADKTIIGAVYSIYDNTGKVVLTGKLHSENTSIELGNLSGGIYMFSVGEKIKQTFKVIKE